MCSILKGDKVESSCKASVLVWPDVICSNLYQKWSVISNSFCRANIYLFNLQNGFCTRWLVELCTVAHECKTQSEFAVAFKFSVVFPYIHSPPPLDFQFPSLISQSCFQLSWFWISEFAMLFLSLTCFPDLLSCSQICWICFCVFVFPSCWISKLSASSCWPWSCEEAVRLPASPCHLGLLLGFFRICCCFSKFAVRFLNLPLGFWFCCNVATLSCFWICSHGYCIEIAAMSLNLPLVLLVCCCASEVALMFLKLLLCFPICYNVFEILSCWYLLSSFPVCCCIFEFSKFVDRIHEIVVMFQNLL